MSAEAAEGSDAARLMDRIYRPQRAIYDLTRAWYLLGRDRLIADLDPPPGARVLEIACGTARNLVRFARRHPRARLYGLDVSAAMLETAGRSVRRAGLADRIRLRQADAGAVDSAALFEVPGFDRIVISYALSMIPGWEQAVAAALRALTPGGELHIVDFGQQERLPGLFRALLFRWLALFHVTPVTRLPERLDALAAEAGRRVTARALLRGYAVLAVIR